MSHAAEEHPAGRIYSAICPGTGITPDTSADLQHDPEKRTVPCISSASAAAAPWAAKADSAQRWENGTLLTVLQRNSDTQQPRSALWTREHLKWNQSCSPVKTVPKHFSDWVNISSGLTRVACRLPSRASATLGRETCGGAWPKFGRLLLSWDGAGTGGQVPKDTRGPVFNTGPA